LSGEREKSKSHNLRTPSSIYENEHWREKLLLPMSLESIIEADGYWAMLAGIFLGGETILVLGCIGAKRPSWVSVSFSNAYQKESCHG
jgi:hypothetical protein